MRPPLLPSLSAALLLSALAIVPALSQSDPIAERQETMGDLSEAHKLLSAMVKGHTPYDAGAATKALQSIVGDAEKLPSMFPFGSESGDDTRASPAIWQDPTGFADHIAKLQAAAQAAIPVTANGLTAFTPAYEELVGTCNACHKAYRLEKPAGTPAPAAAPAP